MKVKHDFLRMGKFNLGDGTQVRFSEDTWYEKYSFKDRYPDLFSIVRKKKCGGSKSGEY